MTLHRDLKPIPRLPSHALRLYYWAPSRPARMPNQRLKLSARGGRVVGNCSLLSAAAAGRSLSAIR